MSSVFVSWSGGKESSLACYRAKANGLTPSYLLNMTVERIMKIISKRQCWS